MSKRVLELIEKLKLRVPEGKLVGKPIQLLPFQLKIIEDAFFNRATRLAIISIGRKNGKTALVAVIAILALLGFRIKENSFLAVGARSRDQASILFTYMQKMINMSPVLSKVLHIKDAKKESVCPSTGIHLRCMSADAITAFGYSPALVIHDELGQVRGPRDAFFDALETATGAHDEPLSIIISTQAAQDGGVLSTLIDDAQEQRDPATKLFFYTADPELPVTSEKAWKQANPALGIFRSLEELRRQAKKAIALPSFESTFRNLYLNQRVELSAPLVSVNLWRANGGEPDPDVLLNFPVFGALDLSARHDLTAFVMAAFDDNDVAHVFPTFWTPAGTLKERASRDRAPYDVWVDEGFLRVTPGNTVSYEHVARDIQAILESSGAELTSLAYDRWRIDDFRRACERSNLEFPLIPYGQGYKDMSPAIEAVEIALSDKHVMHGNHPILTWNVANVFVSSDPAGNRKLNKQKATGRIDGAQAMVMAFGSRNMAASVGDFAITSL